MSYQGPPLTVSIPVSGDDLQNVTLNSSPSLPHQSIIYLFDLIRLLLLIGCLRTFSWLKFNILNLCENVIEA